MADDFDAAELLMALDQLGMIGLEGPAEVLRRLVREEESRRKRRPNAPRRAPRPPGPDDTIAWTRFGVTDVYNTRRDGRSATVHPSSRPSSRDWYWSVRGETGLTPMASGHLPTREEACSAAERVLRSGTPGPRGPG